MIDRFLDSALDFVVDYVLRPFAIIALIAIVFGTFYFVGYLIWHRNDPEPKTARLSLDEWECKNTELYTYTTFILAGKVNVPQTHTSSRCILWGKK